MSDEHVTLDLINEVPKKKVIKKKRKPRKTFMKRGHVSADPVLLIAKVPAEFAGLNPRECCNACDKDGCVISGSTYCGHPFKGGLQNKEMNDHEAMKRFNRAKAALKDQQVDLTLR
jgi:hypothetical protein